MTENPFPGAASKIKVKKEKTKVYKRDGIKCTCGAILEFFTTLYYIHDNSCIINTKRNK